MFNDWNYCRKGKMFFHIPLKIPKTKSWGIRNFSSNLDLFISNINDKYPTYSILIGNFDAKSSKWCNSDRSNRAGIDLHNITTSAGYSQLINEPTHFINKTSSCIDLIFSSDLNITRNCGIEKAIHENVIMIL